jgi:hypothetical protein
MPDNLNTVQQLTIPQSMFKRGDLVKYSLGFLGSTAIYFGEIVGRIWTETEDSSDWEYIVHVSTILNDGMIYFSQDEDFVPESKLSFFHTTI